MQVALTGLDPVQGTATVPAADGCVTPTSISATYGTHLVTLKINAQMAAGQTSQPLSPGDISVTIDTDTWTTTDSANAPQGSSGTLTETSGGNGNVTVQHLFDSSSAQGPSSDESGTISWTCAP
jgi:hypothetical protein